MENKSVNLEEVESSKEWVKLTPKKVVEFKGILKVLGKYYNAISSDATKSKGQIFRDNLSVAEGGSIYLKKFGNYEYLVFAKIGEEHDTWIHMDGISEEREQFTAKGIKEHPVFNITCVGDLYGNEQPNREVA